MTQAAPHQVAVIAAAAIAVVAAPAAAGDPIDDRVRGMLIGSAVGDAVGGPVEFVPGERLGGVLPRFADRPEATVDAAGLRRLSETLPLLPYGEWRPNAEPYGQWSSDAPAGTVTDDTRHKIVLIDALRADPLAGPAELARAYVRFAERSEVRRDPERAGLDEEGFREYRLAARWVLGGRDPRRALPPERMWGGLATCCGQMGLPPVSALHPGDPQRAYLAAYGLGWFDNGEAKDSGAAIVAGLADALVQPIPAPDTASRHAAWRRLLDVMKRTDPYRYAEVEFVGRALSRSIDRATELAARAKGSPARLYQLIGAACPREHAWEARFLLIECVAIAEFARGEPLAAIHLAMDFGEDTDSATQLLGAWFGALYGEAVFPAAMRRPVTDRLRVDYGESIDDWVAVLARARAARADAAMVTPRSAVK